MKGIQNGTKILRQLEKLKMIWKPNKTNLYELKTEANQTYYDLEFQAN